MNPASPQAGEAFVSRMAASLLTGVGLAELVATNRAQYEALAIELANNAQKLFSIKTRLHEGRLTSLLFDSAKFTCSLEQAYTQMWSRYQQDLPPDQFLV